jgi:hypothetical protein
MPQIFFLDTPCLGLVSALSLLFFILFFATM